MTACTCPAYRLTLNLPADTDAERVAAMVAQGIDHWTASRAVWGGQPLPPLTPAEVPAWVRLLTAIRFPGLRLEAGSGCLLAASLFLIVLAVGAR